VKKHRKGERIKENKDKNIQITRRKGKIKTVR
jgi:hypothetical protein